MDKKLEELIKEHNEHSKDEDFYVELIAKKAYNLGKEEREIKCESDGISYLTNPAQSKCKICGQFWVQGASYPKCLCVEKPLPQLPEKLTVGDSDKMLVLGGTINAIIDYLKAQEKHD